MIRARAGGTTRSGCCSRRSKRRSRARAVAAPTAVAGRKVRLRTATKTRRSEHVAHFIQEIVDADKASGKWGGKVATRFPPEPNGYLHIGHAKSICLNYGPARDNGGKFNLRFDDTNPAKEDQEYVDSIIEDVRWMGADFRGEVLYASDYFEQMYGWAQELIRKGKAYVCDLTPEQMEEYRG